MEENHLDRYVFFVKVTSKVLVSVADLDGINAERKSLGIRNYRYCSSAKLRFTSNAHEPPVTNHCMLNYNRRNRSISCCFPITRPPYCALPSDNNEKSVIFFFSKVESVPDALFNLFDQLLKQTSERAMLLIN